MTAKLRLANSTLAHTLVRPTISSSWGRDVTARRRVATQVLSRRGSFPHGPHITVWTRVPLLWDFDMGQWPMPTMGPCERRTLTGADPGRGARREVMHT